MQAAEGARQKAKTEQQAQLKAADRARQNAENDLSSAREELSQMKTTLSSSSSSVALLMSKLQETEQRLGGLAARSTAAEAEHERCMSAQEQRIASVEQSQSAIKDSTARNEQQLQTQHEDAVCKLAQLDKIMIEFESKLAAQAASLQQTKAQLAQAEDALRRSAKSSLISSAVAASPLVTPLATPRSGSSGWQDGGSVGAVAVHPAGGGLYGQPPCDVGAVASMCAAPQSAHKDVASSTPDAAVTAALVFGAAAPTAAPAFGAPSTTAPVAFGSGGAAGVSFGAAALTPTFGAPAPTAAPVCIR